MACFHLLPETGLRFGDRAWKKKKKKKRSKDILKRRSAEGQSSCVPPGKNHMPREKESRENTAAAGGCVCACVHSHMHAVCICTCRCVHFSTKRRTTEEDGGHVWVFGKTLMSTIWTTAENREEQAALCSTDDFSYIDSVLRDKDSEERGSSSVIISSLEYLIRCTVFFFPSPLLLRILSRSSCC